ncbi:hypothetical protein [Streptomyces sp. NPDC047000]|uniref:hypothetical protein n=1 Tax=Streptomyces sp. NPDC047000 TaxID=3155474 RepID=UPI0033F1C5A9
MTHARTLRMSGVLAVCGTLLVGCTDGSDGRHGGRTPATGSTASAASGSASSAGSSPGATAGAGSGPAKTPRTAAQAEALIARVIAGPDLFGAGVRRGTPYERDRSRLAVLGEDCLWRLDPLPEDVLATRTRRFEVPASAGRGRVRLTATVTVHRSALAAAWGQAEMLQEALVCDEQTQRQGERLTGLVSLALAYGEGNNVDSDDSLLETGKCVSDTDGGPYPYWWQQMLLGPVVTSTSVCGGRGWTEAELTALFDHVLPTMLVRVQNEVGPPGALGGKAAETSPGPSGTETVAPGVKDATGTPVPPATKDGA